MVISGPSGAGKSSICQRLLEMPELNAQLSVSATTRSPRPGEVDGVHYRFITPEDFDRLEESGGLLESAEVFADRYGTPQEGVDEALSRGKTVLLDIDVQGARTLRKKGIEGLYYFIAPPSLETLEKRLRDRKTEGPMSLSRRLAAVKIEMSAQDEYDRTFVNDDLERVSGEIRAAILAIKPSEKGDPEQEELS
ncbi:MAG: guanylate kinase [Planctomycetota bacterium]|nr:guanylate kinase [Planctomycetota bacterium]